MEISNDLHANTSGTNLMNSRTNNQAKKQTNLQIGRRSGAADGEEQDSEEEHG